jgi:hypothetical protein
MQNTRKRQPRFINFCGYPFYSHVILFHPLQCTHFIASAMPMAYNHSWYMIHRKLRIKVNKQTFIAPFHACKIYMHLGLIARGFQHAVRFTHVSNQFPRLHISPTRRGHAHTHNMKFQKQTHIAVFASAQTPLFLAERVHLFLLVETASLTSNQVLTHHVVFAVLSKQTELSILTCIFFTHHHASILSEFNRLVL